MSLPPVVRRRRRDRHRFVLGLVALGVTATGLTSTVTGAVFTDSQSVTGNTFTTGTVRLGLTPATAALTLPGMAPGDTVTAPVRVTNTGSLAQRYALVSTTDAADADVLAAQLQLSVKTGVTTCTTAGFGAGGTVVYGPGPLGSVAGTPVLGNVASGAQTGDRAVPAGGVETLCLQVSLPVNTGNSYQNRTTTAVLRFDAEQTANNP